ncbi:MAG: PQQ-binding-like beta-propeller repeat protein [Pirellulales bacterium]
MQQIRLLCFAVAASGLLLVLSSAFVSAADHTGLEHLPKLTAKRDWPWWRGPSRKGIATAAAVPVTFSDKGGYLWKAPVPGRGHSSPVVVGERIFLTTSDEANQTQSMLAFSRASGELLWNEKISQGGFPAKNHRKNSAATPTVACDGERVFASFFHHQAIHVTALGLDGQRIWQKTVGPFNPKMYEYGYAPSPLLYRGTVIISAEYDGDSFLVALDRKNGQEVWRTPRPASISYSSPVVAHVAGKDQLLISGFDQVSSFDPASGKPLWKAKGTTMATCGTAVWENDLVFASGGYPGAETVAIRADGSGKVLWKNNQRQYEQSLLAHDGYVYAFTGQGIAFCWRASDGREMWRERLKGPVSASPVVAGDNIYWANELGTLFVFKANPERFELLSTNQVGTDSFPSPAICGGQVFLRVGDSSSGKRQEFLYCFGQPQ